MILVRAPVLYVSVCLIGLILLANCRREVPSLVDLNRDPETFLTNAPPETSDTDFLVRLYWRGTDADGIVVRYIWAITDTVLPPEGGADNPQNWNPALRLDDLVAGRFTEKTDSVFIFKGYREIGGSGVLRARQVFNIAAIDDNGKIDPTPARIQFFANARSFPKIFFTLNYSPRFPTPRPPINKTLCRGCPTPPDTVGMYQDFTLSWHGETENGTILGYKWVDRGISGPDLNGDGLPDWGNYPAIDTFLYYPNFGSDVLPSGKFTLFMTALDGAEAQSQNERAEVVVNYDPDTKFTDKAVLWYNPRVGPIVDNEIIDLTDGVPDTVPYGAILKTEFIGRDSPFDSLRPPDDAVNFPNYNPIQFAFRFFFTRNTGGPLPITGQQPWTTPFDTDPAQIPPPGTPIDTDSISVNIGSAKYLLQARSMDENERFDGSPDTVEVWGNFPPKIDSIGAYYRDLFNNQIWVRDTMILDADPNNGPPNGIPSSFELVRRVNDSLFIWLHTWTFQLFGTGQDHPKDPDASGVKAWRYRIIDPDTSVRWGPESTWIDGPSTNLLDSPISVTATALGFLVEGDREHPRSDLLGGRWLETNPPRQFGFQTIRLQGRDSAVNQAFDQKLRLLDPVSNTWIMQVVNTFNDGSMGRVSTELNRRIYIKVVR